MPRLNVIKKSGEFSFIIKNGHGLSGPFFIFYLKKAEAPPHFGICTGKKIGCAVCRNRVRRRIREIVRSLLPCFEDFGSLVVIARKRAVKADFGDMKRSFFEMSSRLGLTKRESRFPDPAGIV